MAEVGQKSRGTNKRGAQTLFFDLQKNFDQYSADEREKLLYSGLWQLAFQVNKLLEDEHRLPSHVNDDIEFGS